MPSALRVALDATAVPADRGGVGRYIDDLLPALARTGVRLTLVAQGRDAALFSRLAPAADVVVVGPEASSPPRRLAWEQVGLPRLLGRLAVDVLHSPHYTLPALARVPVTVTLHDATFFSHPELHSAVKGRFFRTATRVAVRRAASLVVPSVATRDEVRRHAGGEEGRFHVAHHGVDRATFHPVDDADRARVARSLGVTGPYVAFLGTLEPRKNVPALIRAWVRVARDLPDPPALVLAGGRGWDTEVDPAAAAVPPGLQLVRPGYLPLADLPGFLSGATVVAYPSLGEGFGLPVLEAMACGSAVLTTRMLSLPEVGGDAVAYSDTTEDSIAAELGALLADAPRRAALAAAARERAAGFTWDASARVHVAAYGAAVRSRSDAR